MKETTSKLFAATQEEICLGLEKLDGRALFVSDRWHRSDEGGSAGGGGITRVLRQGDVFEQAGVNFSEVHGTLPEEMSARLTGSRQASPFFATGISLVLHPFSPMVPTVHANLRYLEVGDHSWFGGGADLTPFYLFPEDVSHFHSRLKKVCDRHDPTYYARFKKWCDEYFYLAHRGETRGVGGIFFDYLDRELPHARPETLAFVRDIAADFLNLYLPIAERRRHEIWGDKERDFQLWRRGRYAEFNLLYDRGTQFGLQTGGRTESILISMPPLARWHYSYSPAPESREAELLAVLASPREWV